MERPTTGHASKKSVMRSPMLKKRSKVVPLSERVTLERVLGVTVKDDSTFACDPNTGLIAYPAGCVIVLFNPRNNKQAHIFNHSKKTITALAFSGDGKNLVSGECGHNPAVRVWDVDDRSQVTELQGHKYGVACVAFSPNLRYVVSIGEQHDMAVNVWNWKDGTKICCGKISNKVTGLTFSEDGGMFVTVGNRNVKFWYLSAKKKTRETVPINGRSGILGEQRNNFFCSVACGKGLNHRKTYCITKSGLLCEFNDSRLLDKWVELRSLSAYCLAASEDHLYVGCADGVLRVFDASTLHFVATFPKPHFLGVNVSDGIDPSHMVRHRDNAQYPDTIALVHDDVNKKVTCIYNDHSIYVWDVHDIKKIGKQWSFLYHSSCIWGVEVYPKMLEGHREMLPPGSFITCSSDDTIRIWNTDPAMTSDLFKRNIYSKELLKILYVDKKYEHLLDVDYNPAGTSDKTDPGEGKNGVRCLFVSPDGQYLASGDRSGNVRVHDLQFMDELYCIEAHDSEVLCLEFTKPETGFNLLASASRDRLIHVFNMEEQCSLLQTVDDHSASITAVKFTYTNRQLQMISCGADKALMFRTAVQNPDFQFLRSHHVVGKQTLYDIAIDPTKKFVATACQDRNIRIHNTVTGKLKRIYKGSLSDDGTLIKVELDPSGMYVATSCSDKTLAIFDFYSGECVATMTGHSELVTGIKFTQDCKHLISVSGDGCIFLWQLPWGLTHNMKERLAEMGQAKRREQQQYNMLRRGTYVVPPELPLRVRSHNTRNNNNNTVTEEEEVLEDVDESDFEPADVATLQAKEQLALLGLESHSKRESIPQDYRFSMGQLPLWAKKQVSGEDIPSPTTYSSPSQPKGRWAQSIDSKGIKVKSEWENTIELRLEDCLDRRRYTVEPDALLDQVRILSHIPDFPVSEEEFQDSVDAEFLSAEDGLEKFERDLTDSELERLNIKSFVTSTRGSDPFLPPSCLSGEEDSSLAQDDSQETSQDEEDDTTCETSSAKDEEEAKEEDIIYPPSDETPSSPENLKFEITASTQSFEEHARRKRSREEHKDSCPEKVIDDASKESEITDPISISTDEDEEDVEEMEDDSLEEEESSTSASESKGDTTAASDTHDLDEEHFLHTNFSFMDKDKLTGFMEKEKFGRCLEQLQSGFEDDVCTGRLSISSKFLSRSQLSHARGPVMGIHGLAATSGGISAEQYLLRRKQEMAMAVDKTRRRLQMLGWKVSEAGKKPATASTEVLPTSLDRQISSSSNSSKESVSGQVAAAISATADTDGKESELDSADSLEEVEGVIKTLEQRLTADNTNSEMEKEKSDLNCISSKTGKYIKCKSPQIAPKPGRRKRNNSREGDRSKQESSSSSSSLSSSGEEFSKSEESLELNDSTRSPNNPKEQPRKKELPAIPVLLNIDGSVNKETSSCNDGRRASSGSGCKAKANKVKNKKEREVVMRRAASMTDIGAELATAPENTNRSPSLHSMTLRGHPRSHSSERAIVRSVPNSPAREKRRARTDRIVPLLPNQQQKLRSYEIGTQSSRAKAAARTDTPPSSPYKLYKKKRSLLSELKDNKNKPNESKDKDVGTQANCQVHEKICVGSVCISRSESEETVEHNGASKEESVLVRLDAQSTDVKSKIQSPISIKSLETDENVKHVDEKLPRSDIPSCAKEDADRIAMPPPPTSIRISRTRTAHKSSDVSKVNKNRIDLEGVEKPTSDDNRDQKEGNSVETVTVDSDKSVDAAMERQNITTNGHDTVQNGHDTVQNGHDTVQNGHNTVQNGHDTVQNEQEIVQNVHGPVQNGHDTVQNGHNTVQNGHGTVQNGHDTILNGHGTIQNGHDIAINSHDDTETKNENVSSVNGDEVAISKGASAGSGSLSPAFDYISDCMGAPSPLEPTESAGVPSVSVLQQTKGKMILDLSSPIEPFPPPEEMITPDELRAGVDGMKTAFDNCLAMFTKATSPETPDKSKGHQMLDYLASTLNTMQVSVARLQSQRRRFLSSASEISMSDSMSSLTSLHDRSRATSVGFLSRTRKGSSSSLTESDVDNLKMSFAKTKTPGNGKSRDEDTEAASALVLLDHYSEMLVSMVRDKIVEDLNEGTLAPTRSGPTRSSSSNLTSDV